MWIRSTVVAVLLVLVGCGRGPGEPSELVGTWRSDLPPAVLEIEEEAFRLESGHLTKWGTLQRTPFRMAFVLTRTSSPAFRLYCRGVVDVYDWRIDGDSLQLHAVGQPCDGAARTVLVAATWRRVSR